MNECGAEKQLKQQEKGGERLRDDRNGLMNLIYLQTAGRISLKTTGMKT